MTIMAVIKYQIRTLTLCFDLVLRVFNRDTFPTSKKETLIWKLLTYGSIFFFSSRAKVHGLMSCKSWTPIGGTSEVEPLLWRHISSNYISSVLGKSFILKRAIRLLSFYLGGRPRLWAINHPSLLLMVCPALTRHSPFVFQRKWISTSLVFSFIQNKCSK